MSQITFIDLQSKARRVLLLLALLPVIGGAWLVGRIFFANVFAEVAPSAGEAGRNSVLWAVRTAPNDPLAHRALGGLERRSFDLAAQQRAAQQFTEAARLSPHDYRIWIDLGQTRQQIDDFAGAEQALRRAVEAAPHYAAPRWFLGNFLLRQGRYDESFVELQRACDANAEYRPQFYNAVWQVSGKNLDLLRRAAGDTASARADLASFLVNQQRPEDALQVWNSLQPQEKQQFAALGATLSQGFLASKKYHAALSVVRGLAASEESAPKVGQITDGGFEAVNANGAFDWQTQPSPQAQSGLDTARQHGGKQSLRVNFKSTGALDFRNVTQLVAVESGARYRLEWFVRTDSLKTAGPPVVQILDAATQQIIATSEPTPTGTSKNWLPAAVSFATRGEGVIVRLAREGCGTETSCPIFGTVWFDDFTLNR